MSSTRMRQVEYNELQSNSREHEKGQVQRNQSMKHIKQPLQIKNDDFDPIVAPPQPQIANDDSFERRKPSYKHRQQNKDLYDLYQKGEVFMGHD